MQVTADQTDPCTVVLDIVVDEPQVSRAFETSFREFSRYVNVPGFRPGKAPRILVERYVDMARLRQHTLEKIIRESYPDAVQEKDITPYRDPDIEPTDLEDKKPYKYRVIIPLEPKVELGPYTGLTVEKPIFTITDHEVEERIQSLRKEKARLERVTDRGIEDGDVVIAEHEITVEGDEAPEPARRQLVRIGNNIPGYDEAVLGMQPGEEKTFELTYPDDFDVEDRRGKKATYHVTVSSISSPRLPDLDDEFVQQVSDANSVEEFYKQVKERLEAEAIRVSNEVAEQRLIEKIVQASTVNFPAILVREEVQDKLRQLGQDLERNQMSYDAYLQRIGQSAEQHQNGVAAQSAEQIRALLALREIAINEGLQADAEAIDSEFDRFVAEGHISEETLVEYRSDSRRRLQVANALIQQKLHDFLFANNTLVEVDRPLRPEHEAGIVSPDDMEAASVAESAFAEPLEK